MENGAEKLKHNNNVSETAHTLLFSMCVIEKKCKVILGPAGRARSVRPAGKKSIS